VSSTCMGCRTLLQKRLQPSMDLLMHVLTKYVIDCHMYSSAAIKCNVRLLNCHDK
jgi:hypothetical protein